MMTITMMITTKRNLRSFSIKMMKKNRLIRKPRTLQSRSRNKLMKMTKRSIKVRMMRTTISMKKKCLMWLSVAL